MVAGSGGVKALLAYVGTEPSPSLLHGLGLKAGSSIDRFS